MLTFIVGALLAALAAVLTVWLLSPSYRQSMEWPKFRFLQQERRFAANRAARPLDHP